MTILELQRLAELRYHITPPVKIKTLESDESKMVLFYTITGTLLLQVVWCPTSNIITYPVVHETLR